MGMIKCSVRKRKKRLHHGKIHEIDALATLAGKVLPVYQPKMNVKEVGSYTKKYQDQLFFISSPDGEGWDGERLQMTFEFKCPYPKIHATPVFYDIPKYYVPQILSQLNLAENGPLDEAIFLSWSYESSTAFFVANDRELWQSIEMELQEIYGCDHPICPKKKRDNVQAIKQGVEQFLLTNVSFLGEFHSAEAITCRHKQYTTEPLGLDDVHQVHSVRQQVMIPHSLLDIEGVLKCVETAINDAFILTRPRATDVFVYILSDLDRTKNVGGSPLAIPVYYGLAGSSLSSDTIRNLTNFIRSYLKSQGLSIITQGFDGQMWPLAVLDESKGALTVLHEQKNCYSTVSKKKKQDVVSEIHGILGEEPTKPETSPEEWAIIPSFSDLDDDTKQDIQRLNSRLIHSIQATAELLQPKCNNDELVSGPISSLMKIVKAEMAGNSSGQLCKDDTTEEEKSAEEILTAVQTDIALFHEVRFPEEESFDEIVVDLDNLVLWSDDHSDTPNDHENNDAEQDDDDISDQQHTTFFQSELDKCLETMLISLQTCSSKLQKRWETDNTESLKAKLTNAETINKACTVEDLREIIKSLKGNHILEGINLKSLHYKSSYVNVLSKLFGDGSSIESKQKPAKRCKSLKNILQTKLRKHTLNVLLCTLEWPEKIRMWYAKGLIPNGRIIEGMDENFMWITQPEIDTDGQPIFTFLDFHHLLTNTRCHVGRKGYPAASIRREAWVQVAEDEQNNKTGLNIALVDDSIDSQSNAVAQLFFSENVEMIMRSNGHLSEAELCALMRHWYEALDQRGMSSRQRAIHLIRFRKWLSGILVPKLMQFPPVTTHIDDIPIVNFEGLLISTERFLKIYPFVQGNTFNPRSLGSQMNENFFSSFRDLDPKSDGVLKPTELPKAMGIACQLLESRLNPDRYETKCGWTNILLLNTYNEFSC